VLSNGKLICVGKLPKAICVGWAVAWTLLSMTLKFGLLYRVGGMSESDESPTVACEGVFDFFAEPPKEGCKSWVGWKRVLEEVFGLLDGFRRTGMVEGAASFGDFDVTGEFRLFGGSNPFCLMKEITVSPNGMIFCCELD
jgi:hypothetical protein